MLHSLDVFEHGYGTVPAHQFAPVMLRVSGIAAKYTGRLIFLEDNFLIVNVNFQRVFFIDTHCAAKLYRYNYAAQLVHFSYYTCCLQDFPSLFDMVNTIFDKIFNAK